MYRGDIRLGDTIDFKFTTRRFSTGAPFTLAGTPSVAAYVDNGTTEITAGITLTVDFDSRTGLNNVRVVATSGNGFAAGTNVDIVITAGTVDSVSVVGEVVGSFSIEKRSALMPTTSGRTLDVSAGGEAGIDWANIGSPTTAVNLSSTNFDTDQVVASVTGAVGSVTGNVGGNVSGNVTGTIGGLTAAALKDFFDTDSTTAYGSAVAGSVVKEIADNSAGGSAPSAATIADAVWDEATAGHVGAGSFGLFLQSLWTTALTESYAADGATFTPAQALYMIVSFLLERNISGTTLTCKKLDGSTTAMTLTLNSATQPTSTTRSS